MRKRILALLLCICMASAGFVYTFADGTDQNGDANGDGSVSVSDASLVLRYCVGLDYRMTMRGRMLADADCDGTIEAEDAAAILRHIAGLNSLQTNATDADLLTMLNRKSNLKDRDLTEWVARFIQFYPEGDVKNVLNASAKYIGKSYSEYTCDKLIYTIYRDAGIPTTVYPNSTSDGTLTWFRKNHSEFLHETTIDSWRDWKSGNVLIYTDPNTGKGNHLALYVGAIDGKAIVIDSGTSDGVRLTFVWEYDKWIISYYGDPVS